jgi:signal transduction histidine kinase
MTKSPTIRLLVGLFVTLAAVTGFSWYSLSQLHKLRNLQTGIIDLNRHDSLLLLRVQNDINTIGLQLRDMTQTPESVGIGTFRGEFSVLRSDLEDAIRAEARLSPVTRRPDKQARLVRSLDQFWKTSDQVFQEAAAGNDFAARALISKDLSAQQSMLATQVSYLLERNTEAEQSADQVIASIYDGVERNIYAFLAAIMLAILGTSLYLIYSNRELFSRLESMSRQRRVLAAKLITVQEEVLRSVSRELHDEFGQILTAVGAMLQRAERKGVPPDSPLRTELSEVREITHNTLEKMRSLSQILHPAVLDDYGLAKGIEWYTGVFERQTGIQTVAHVFGDSIPITGQPAIHCFRIVQEALNNAAKHSGTKKAEVDMIFAPGTLTVKVKDYGRGMLQHKKGSTPGLGLIAMRERAELIGGDLQITSVPNEGSTLTLSMPVRQPEQTFERSQHQTLEEVVSRNHE